MIKSAILGLVLLFGLTLLGGVLTDNQTKVIHEVGNEVLDRLALEETTEDIADEIGNVDVAPDTQKENSTVTYEVVRVIDGDTIVISKLGINETIRLIGVDTPETVHPSKPVQCFGKEASQKTKDWLEGEKVYLEIDETQGERDKYGRLLAYVYRADGLFINLELIMQGYAYEYTYNLPYKYQLKFKESEQFARTNGVGLWAESACQ